MLQMPISSSKLQAFHHRYFISNNYRHQKRNWPLPLLTEGLIAISWGRFQSVFLNSINFIANSTKKCFTALLEKW